MKLEKLFTENQFARNGITGFKVPMHEFNCVYGSANIEPYFLTPISYEVGEVVAVWAEIEFAKGVRRDFVLCKVVSCCEFKSSLNRFKIGLQICNIRTSI